VDEALNLGFFVFHTGWIVFTCLGWAWRRTRTWHLAAVLVTALSWIGFGPWYGWGYCPFTDWHWDVRDRLGLENPPSYIQLLVRELTGVEVDASLADAAALLTIVAVATLGILLRIRDRSRRRPSGSTTRGAA
jgi:hypothetical protein